MVSHLFHCSLDKQAVFTKPDGVPRYGSVAPFCHESLPGRLWRPFPDLSFQPIGIKARQTGTKAMKQGQFSTERLTHIFASFDS